jgi:hypothetical protein
MYAVFVFRQINMCKISSTLLLLLLLARYNGPFTRYLMSVTTAVKIIIVI